MACIALNTYGCFVAKHNDVLVGYIFSRKWEELGRIGTFEILPDRQGMGIGKILIKRAQSELKSLGHKYVGLETRKNNQNMLEKILYPHVLTIVILWAY